MAHSSSSLRSNSFFSSGSPKSTRGLLSSSGSTSKIQLHQADNQLQKEIDRLERQQNAAVSNIANHQQVMKMSWRKLEQRRSVESPILKQRSGSMHSPSTGAKKSMFHTNPMFSAGGNVWKDPRDTDSGVVTVSGDVHHKRLGQYPPLSSATRAQTSPYLSPYVSSPFNARRGSLPPNPRSRLNSDNSTNRLLVTHLSSSKVADTEVSDKETLLKTSKLIGIESSKSEGPNRFKDFYKTGGSAERSSSASHLVTSALDQSINLSREEKEEKDLHVEEVNGDPGELSMAEMFEQIKKCRYIRKYRPDGTALEEFY